MANSTEEERIREVVVVGAANVARLAMTITTQFLFHQIPKEPCVNYVSDRNTYMDSVLKRDRKCKSNLRMRADAFRSLCSLIRGKKLLEDTRNCEVEEMVMRFLHLIGHNVRHRAIESRYYRSLETISRQFNETLDAILKLYPCLVADHGEPTHNGGTPSQIFNGIRYEKYFKNCLGALDGTHIVATVPGDEVERFRSGRKSFTSQNVLAACSFDLKFTYVLVGWEGTTHDQRVLDDARTRPNPFRIPQGIYL
ncbi:hypothetical protein AQUCO_00300371v1 [Aquilegia coerulea]|uniref:Uncharacterized protein n=1 Tax=Aquilegia coerulea TaxID=218851 RepID=A0A2G5EYK2_AQUCA|nr:hypothetical protein AQUCO_00300371v1 [Aquilegia coerulea]